MAGCAHGIEHWTEYYTDYGVDLQRRFFDHFLKGEDNGWDAKPPVQLNIRSVDSTFVGRTEDAWPLERTVWTRYHLDAETMSLRVGRPEAAGAASYDTTGDGLLFSVTMRDSWEMSLAKAPMSW